MRSMYCDDSHGDIKQPNHNKQHEESTNQLVRTRTIMTTMNRTSVCTGSISSAGETC